ncbi:S8/S53 family peptidase [Flavobacterium chungnamense]|uniref:T9SS type A sorting domain-containing protein n=1 Tax=Flavobacterium chungnamense TaxID=706182 RepID=A0ABP7V2Z7_9FLAO
MKNKITKSLSLFMLLLSLSLYSQNIPTDKSKFLKFETSQEISKLSLSTKFILQEAKQNKTNDVTSVNLNSLVRITLLFEGECQNFNKKNIFLNVAKISENISTAFVKIENLPLLESIQCLKYADIGEKLDLEVNNARNSTNTNSVHMGTGISQAYTGTGVIVGIIDGGFDYTHPNFKDINGNLRISRVWERTNSTGTPPTSLGFTYGSEYIGTTAILNKQKDMINESHGTHVAGTAAGTGTGNLSLLKGMAPNAEIVLVSGFNTVIPTDNNYIDAITYIKNYATSVNKPVVINMSFGDDLGPHDGTTAQESAINNMANTPKLVLVAAAGNDGGKNKHALLNYTNEINKYLVIDNTSPVVNSTPTADNVSTIDIWSQNLSTSGSFEILIWVENLFFGTVDSTPIISGVVNGTASATFDLIDTDNCSGCTNDQYTVILNSEINPINNKMHLTIKTLNDNDDLFDRLIIAIKSTNNTIHAWSRNCQFGSYTGYNFTEGDDYFTVGSPGTASGVITVGSYNVSNENPFPGTNGTLSTFSSKGPRADSNLTIKPDVTAPGNRIVSSLSSFDTNYQPGGEDVTNTYGTHSYGKMQGTSMAAPVVTGIVALWLQAAPQLTSNDVKILIANTSNPDSQVTTPFDFYGNTYSSPPNIKWGYGKINALAGMQLIEQVLNVDTFDNTNNFIVYPNPTSSKVYFDNSNFNFKEVTIYNYLGQEVAKTSFNNNVNNQEIDMSNLATGVYVLKFSDGATSKSVKVVKQ